MKLTGKGFFRSLHQVIKKGNMSTVVSYHCASCGAGAKKIIGDRFDCTYCGCSNKILNEQQVISFKNKNPTGLVLPKFEEETDKSKIKSIAITVGIVVLGALFFSAMSKKGRGAPHNSKSLFPF